MMGIFSPLNCTGFHMQLTLMHCHWLATVLENKAKCFTHQVLLWYTSKMEKIKVFPFAELSWKGKTFLGFLLKESVFYRSPYTSIGNCRVSFSSAQCESLLNAN